nr:ArgT [Nocardia argentinensis ATCC 31306]
MGFDDDALRLAHDMCTGELARMWAPRGGTEGVQLLSDWLMWALLFDDHYCDEGPISRDATAFNHLAVNLMGYSMYPQREPLGVDDFDAFAASLSDIMTRLRQQTNAEQTMLCALAYYGWGLGASCGVSDRSGQYLRSVDEHLVARPHDGGFLHSIYHIEAAEGSWLDTETRIRPEVQAATAAAGVLLTVPTDVASFARERDQRSLESNMVEVIAGQNRCSRQEALHLTCALLEEVMELFITLKGKLSAEGTLDLNRYLDQLSNMISGTIEWQRRLPRYANNMNDAGESESSGCLREQPIHDVSMRRIYDRVDPPSAISWWWDFI